MAQTFAVAKAYDVTIFERYPLEKVEKAVDEAIAFLKTPEIQAGIVERIKEAKKAGRGFALIHETLLSVKEEVFQGIHLVELINKSHLIPRLMQDMYKEMPIYPGNLPPEDQKRKASIYISLRPAAKPRKQQQRRRDYPRLPLVGLDGEYTPHQAFSAAPYVDNFVKMSPKDLEEPQDC